jgi:hypothetical protein
MKKILFFAAAASALMLTACSSENDVVQSPTNQNTATVQQQELGFDIYTQQATNARRAGRANVMTTTTMQMTGFGVFGYQSDGTHGDGTYGVGTDAYVPNYMWNQQVNYNSTSNGWYYAPLKYWPNETKNDSQQSQAQMPDVSTHNNLDRLTFFAYAPWVSANGTTGAASPLNSDIEAPAGEGIVSMTKNTGKFGATGPTDPKLEYKVNTTDPNKAVDLLWGVAPVGNLSYTAVNKQEITIKEGFPLIDLTKPAVNTNMKFLFQHALARFGFKVVLAADQVAAGGNFDFGSTKVTIEKIEVEGNFGYYGYLNLNNTTTGNNIAKNIANWETVLQAKGANKLVIEGDALAEHLRYDSSLNPTTGAKSQQTHTGVTTEYSDVLQVSSVKDERYNMYSVQEDAPKYSASRPYFATATDNAIPTTTPVHTATYMAYSTWTPNPAYTYFYKTIMNSDKIAYTEITPNVTYPDATFWKNIFSTSTSGIYKVIADDETPSSNEIKIGNTTGYIQYTYRKVGNTYIPTGQKAELGDYLLLSTIDEVPAPTLTDGNKRWKALPNYFMVIPTNWKVGRTAADRTINVKITYWVSTKDENLQDGIVYTKNEVEKAIELPSLDNGKSYNIKMILGMTSVKFEADVADWTTTDAEINLPQNTAE